MPIQHAPKDPKEETKEKNVKEEKEETVLVKHSDGSYSEVSQSEVNARIARQAATNKNPAEEPEPEREFHVLLANGKSHKLKESELPGYAGTNAPHGFIDGVVITSIHHA
jgi:hypothetical protein